MNHTPRPQLMLVLVAAALGLAFAGFSGHDSMQHLDRQLHEVHCSFVPGLSGTAGDNPCRTAMYSSYSAILRGTFWGGIPVALFALGVYAFLGVFALTLLLGGAASSRRAYQFLGVASLGPLLASIVMAVISAVKLGTFCRTCVGMYAASILLAVGALWAWRRQGRGGDADAALDVATTAQWRVASPASGGATAVVGWLAGFGLCVLLPAIVYVAVLPDYRGRLEKCGKLPAAADSAKALLKLQTAHPRRAMTLFVDPLCPTCKALHDRLDTEGVTENLDLTLALLPLDAECNWMVDRSLHQGSCVLSRAVICSEPRAREALEWMYANQAELSRLGKAGEAQLKARLRERFGADLGACLDSKKTRLRLNNTLQYAVNNRVSVSTPQMYLGAQRVCDEDTDLGLRYTLGRLAPEVLQ